QHCRLDATVGEIKARAILRRVGGSAIHSSAAVAVLELRGRKLHGIGVAVRGQAIDYGAARISEAQEFCDLVERLSGCVVARMADIFVSPPSAFLRCQVEVGMASGHYQGEHRELQFVVSLLTFFEQYSVDVALEMIDGNQRLVEGEGKGFRIADADQKSARKPR